MEESKLFPRSKPLCRLSDPAKPHNLCRRSNPPLSVCFSCKGQKHLKRKRYYYYCATCDLEFHRGCHIISSEIRHPFHLIHSLTLIFLNPDFQSSKIPTDWDNSSSGSDIADIDSEIRHPFHLIHSLTLIFLNPDFESYQIPTDWDNSSSGSDISDIDSEIRNSISDGNHLKCKSCRTNLVNEGEKAYYHCSTCNFSLHVRCALIRPPLTIENLKSHDHTLTLFPRQVPLPCDACSFSLDVTYDHVYFCMLCNYMVHRSCMYLPRVIKITRHPHRLSYTSSLIPSDDEFSCGVCRKTVDVNYGNYSCNKGCHYAVHSKCATKNEVWDGIDLEGVPEEEEEVTDPFVRIDDETIQHFSHDHHHLKIHWNGSHENKFCQACTLTITVADRFYSCISCEFVLHETCASLPLRNHHPIHKHPLTLFHPFSSNPLELQTEYFRTGFFMCNGCDRGCCGFMYKCTEKDCRFELDARCASLLDSSIHGCHPHHPLSFNLTQGECMRCNSNGSYLKYLECIRCNSFLCLRCATLPSVAHYKHDKHPLTLCYGEAKTPDDLQYWCRIFEETIEATDDIQYWCEICEEKLDATEWFYTCNSCSVTLHVKCLLGVEEMYMKPNHTISIHNAQVEVSRNSGNSRPVCHKCGDRCKYALVFKGVNGIFCCLEH